MKSKDSFWFSKIQAAQMCFYKYYLQYIKNLVIPGALSADLEFGNALHLAFDAMMNGENYLQVFDVYWDSIAKNDNVEYGRFKWQILKEVGHKFLKNFEKKYKPRIKPLMVEKRVFGTLGEHKVEGTPDLVCEFDDIPSIIDFKSSGYNYSKDRLKIADQLIMYADIIRKKYKIQIEQIIYFVFNKATGTIQRPLILPLNEKTIDKSLNMTKMWIEELKDRKEFPKNHSSCIRGSMVCPYFEKCHGEENES